MGEAAAPGEQRRHREWELDMLVAHELASSSPAAATMWTAVGQPVPAAPVIVLRQAIRDDGRTTDVQAEAADGRLLLCENKAAGGSYEVRQPESYSAHCAGREAWAISVGPQEWLAANHDPHFDGHVAVEDLAAALTEAATHLAETEDSAASELRTSYLYRASQLLDYASDRGYTGNPDDNVTAIGNLYRRLLMNLTGGQLAITQKALRNKRGGFAHVSGFSVERLRAIHKLPDGVIDFGCRGWTMTQLRAWYASLEPAGRPPPGWVPAGPDSMGTPLLRHRSTALQLTTVDPVEAEPVLIDAIEAMLALEAWLVSGGGTALVAGPPGNFG